MGILLKKGNLGIFLQLLTACALHIIPAFFLLQRAKKEMRPNG
jgi:hypothetical protein